MSLRTNGVDKMSIQVSTSWRVRPPAAGPARAEAHRNGVKNFIAAAAALAVLALASPAMAYIVELTTSIDLTDVADKAQLRQAVESAVADVLANAISFSPTIVTVQDARVVGDRMYLMLLIVDAAGEKALEAIAAEDAASRESEGAVHRATLPSTW